jgi:hypothetical protein
VLADELLSRKLGNELLNSDTANIFRSEEMAVFLLNLKGADASVSILFGSGISGKTLWFWAKMSGRIPSISQL